MALLLDSAFVEDARRSAALGYVTGITTNPTLVAKTGRRAGDVIAELCDVHPGTVFYQPISETLAEREAEVRRMAALREGRVGIKLPSTSENFTLAARLAGEGFTVAMTAIFSPAQAYLACLAGVRFVLPYVNRSTRLLGDGPALVHSMRQVIEACGSGTEILSASIKSPEEAVAALLAGSHSLTIPLELILALGHHDLSDAAIADFAASAAGMPR